MKRDSVLLWLISMVKKRIPAMVLMVACNIGKGLLDVAFALGSRQVIDTAVSGDWNAFYRACARQGIIIVGLLLFVGGFRLLREQLHAKLDRDWKKILLHNLLNGEYAAVSSYHSGELINRMTNDVRTVNEGLLFSLPNLVSMITRLAAATIVLVGMEPVFALLLLAFGAIVMAATGLLRRGLKQLNKQVSEANGKVAGMLQELMEKLLIVQAMDVGAEALARTDVLMEERYAIQMRKKNLSLFANTAVSILSYGAGFVTLVYGAGGLLRGTMTFGSLTALTQLVAQLQSPFVNMSGFFPQYVAMLASAERLKELLVLKQQDASEEAVEASAKIYEEMTAIRAQGLSFTYDQNPVLEQAEFTLPKGAFAVITGFSGIGKSTLLKLLLGIYKPEQGGFYLQRKVGNGTEETQLTRNLRGLFAYVPQGNLLFSGTIRENLLLMNPSATENALQQAIYVSAMDEYLDELPLGLETSLQENAGGLSEGQAQRLAIARAILKGSPIILLDEATSALDAETERKVLERLKALDDKTCLIVTHRSAAMELCDMQLEIENMKVHTKREPLYP